MKVTILMSTYNGEQFLEEQIRSIQSQTYTEWNLLIRDDGSTDATQEIIARFVKEDARISWMNQENPQNMGVIRSFYTLTKHEPADFYFFSDQDDVWLPDKLEISLAKAAQYPAEVPLMVYMDLKVVDQNLQVLSESMIRSQSDHANTELVQELTENSVTGGVAMINQALADLWTQTEDILMHDWYLALLATAFGNLVYIDQPGELYRQHGNNVLGARTLSKRVKKWLRPHLLFAAYWKLIQDSQKQAAFLLDLPLEAEKRELVTAFVTLMDKGMLERWRTLRRFGLKKNKAFHTFVFASLILTKFAYRRQ